MKRVLIAILLSSAVSTTALAQSSSSGMEMPQNQGQITQQVYETTTSTTAAGNNTVVQSTTTSSQSNVVTPQQVITAPAEPIIQSTAPVPDDSLEPVESVILQPQTSANGVSYINGGIGSSERKAIKEVQNQYNLKIMNSDKQGRFIGNAALSVFDANNQSVLNITDLGPVFLANLPKGRYRIAVIYQGQTKSKDFVAGSKNKVLNFVW